MEASRSGACVWDPRITGKRWSWIGCSFQWRWCWLGFWLLFLGLTRCGAMETKRGCCGGALLVI
uniref:Uncharacterized protein n=1 Tax=Arundo donax TaxID=35708 RepID=A0A0A8YHL1_ARUDO